MTDGGVMGATVSDEILYGRLLAGDVAALEELIGRWHGPLLGFLYRRTGDRHLAEDLVQETFTRLVTYEGAPPERFKAWAFTIARNCALDHLRSAYHRRERVVDDEDDSSHPVDPDPGALDLLVHQEDRRAVAAALARLSPPQREVVILRFYHEMTLPEIAEVVGVPLGTAKSRLFHGLKQLKMWLAPERAAQVAQAEGGGVDGPARRTGLGRRVHA